MNLRPRFAKKRFLVEAPKRPLSTPTMNRCLMATILILQEQPTKDSILERSLEQFHHLIFADNIDTTMDKVKTHEVDLIVARVHFMRGNVFTFIKTLKQDPISRETPIVCFCGLVSPYAKVQHKALAKATRTSGAVDYLALDQFNKDGNYDLEEIRKCIERYIRTDSIDEKT